MPKYLLIPIGSGGRITRGQKTIEANTDNEAIKKARELSEKVALEVRRDNILIGTVWQTKPGS
jgi:hypothetical protein